MTCESANSEVWRSQTFFTIRRQVEDLLTLQDFGNWLGDFKNVEEPVCIGVDTFALEGSEIHREWLLGNLATSYLKSRLPGLFLIVGRQWVHVSEHRIKKDAPLALHP